MAGKHSIPPELDQLVEQAKSVFRKLTIKRLCASVFLSLAVFLVLLLVFVFLESAFYLSPVLKTAAWVLMVIGSVAAGLLHFATHPAFRFNDFYSDYANTTGIPGLKYAFDLTEYPRNRNSTLYSLALQKNLAAVESGTFTATLNAYAHSRRDHKQFISFSILSILLFAMAVGTFFVAQASFNRTFNFWESYTAPNPYSFKISPGNVTLEQGSALEPVIKFSEEAPAELTLAIKTNTESAYRKRTPAKSGNNQFAFAPLPLNTNTTYYFEMDGYQSEAFTAAIQLRPRFEQLAINVLPPAYTGLDSTRYRYPFSKIEAYPGSQISIAGRTNKTVQQLFLFRNSKQDSVVLDSEANREFSYNWTSGSPDTVRFFMQDEAGLENKNPFQFVLEPIEDEYPYVRLISPEESIEQKNPETVSLQFEAGDDFGLISARLRYRIRSAFSDASQNRQSIKLDVPSGNSTQSYRWNTQKLNLKPRDIVTFWIEVTDNDAVNGPKRSTTRKLTLQIPSITRYLDEVEAKEKNVDQALEDVASSYEQMQREYDRFKEQMKRNPEQNYEQKQKLQNVESRQREVQQKIDELNNKFREMKSEIDRDSLVSKETTKAYKELEKLMREIDDPELQEALKKLQESMGNLSPDQLRKAMENFEFNEQRYKERIERTLELFKKIKLNSDLDKLATAFDELARQEQKLAEDSLGTKTEPQKQEAIRNDANRLKQKVDSLSIDAPQKSTRRIKQLQQETSDELKSIDQNLQNNIEQLKQGKQNGKNEQIKNQQRDISRQLQQLSEQMINARQSLNQQQAQINLQALQYILYSLLNLSENQEKLARQTSNLTSRSQGFVDKARQQQNIEKQFNTLSDSLFSVSSEAPRFSNAINTKKAVVQQQLAAAVRHLSERDKSSATFSERQVLGGINELAAMVASLMRQIQNQQSGSGGGGSMSMQQMMEQMQKMSGRQQQINQQIQDFINDVQGNRLSNDQIERLNQLARQQNTIRKQLKQLQQSGQLQDGDRVLSELERMAEQMEQTINDLRGGQTNELLIKRQQNILSRMLSAEQALQERDKEDKREGTSAEDPPRRVPPDVTIEDLQQRIRQMLNDPDRSPFNDDYQKLIERYFKLLQQLQQDSVSSR